MINRKQSLITILVLIGLSIGLLAVAQHNNIPRQLTAKHTSSCSWSGSAFFINNQGYIATANHVVGCGNRFKVYYKHQYYPAYPVATDLIHDVAILRTNIKVDNYLPLTMFKAQNEPIGVYGYPLGTLVLTLTTGTETPGWIVENVVYSHAHSCHGNSGGPILNQYGEVIGMLNWGYFAGPSSLCSNEGGGPSIQYLIELAAKYRVSVTVEYPYKSSSFINYYVQYNDSIVYIEGEQD